MTDEATVAGPPKGLISGILKAVRPRQWVKNLLVFAAPLAALGGGDTYDYGFVLGRVSIAFVVFCMAASSIYLVNDARDVEAGCCRSAWRTASPPFWRSDRWRSRGGSGRSWPW